MALSPAYSSLGIGMSVPGASGNFGLGDLLGQQARQDTDEERKRKMLEAQQRQTMGPSAYSVLGGSPL